MSTKRRLTSAEALAGIERANARMAESLDDKAAWLEASRERDYYEAAYEDAMQREAEEEAARLRAEREAKRPAAEAAAKACTLEHALAEERDDVRRAVELLADVHRRVAAKVIAIQQASPEAARLCREAGIPFLPTGASPQIVREFFGPVIMRALHDAQLDGFEGYIPAIHVLPVVLTGAP